MERDEIPPEPSWEMSQNIKILVVLTDPELSQSLIESLQQLILHKATVHTSSSLSIAEKFIADQLYDAIFVDLCTHSLSNQQDIDVKPIDILSQQAPGVPLVGILRADQEWAFSKVKGRGLQDYLIVPEWSANLLDRVIRYVLTTKKTTDQIFKLLHFDELTGLSNRPLCNDRISQAIIRCERSGQHVAVLFIDLDNFHGINETLGYKVGDYLLKQIAQRLIGSVRRQDTVSRFGGDEFVVVLEGLNNPQHTTVIAKQILRNFSEPFFYDNQPVFVSTSIGISVTDKESMDGLTLLRQADIARYRSKENGGHNFQYFVPAMNEIAQKNLNLEVELNQALNRIFGKNPSKS